MAEKKKTSKIEKAKETSKKDEKKKKTNNKKTTVSLEKTDDKKRAKTAKEEVVKEEVVKEKKKKKECKIKKWLDNLTLEQITISGIVIIVILLCVLIFVSTKNTKTKNGDDIVVKINGKTITANELYKTLKEKQGKDAAINLVDEYILNKEYKTTDEMITSAEASISNYKSNYGDNYQAFLEYNGISGDAELKDLLIKNEKLTKAAEDYIKDSLTKNEMEDYYEANIKGDIKASHILVSYKEDENLSDEENEKVKNDAKAKANEIIEKLNNGENFAELAKTYSDDTATKEKGGDLGYFNTGEMVTEFEDAAYNLDKNSYSKEPVETEYGYHIILKVDQKDKPKYKKVKSKVIEKLVEQKKENDQNINTKAIINLRKKYKMVIKDKKINESYENYLKTATTTTTVSAN